MTEYLEYRYPAMRVFRIACNPENSTDCLAIEFRKPDSVAFSVLNLSNGSLLLDDWQPPEQPLTYHLAGLTSELLLLYQQQGNRYPDPRGIWAWEITTASLRWQQPNDYLTEVTDRALHTYQVEQGEIVRRCLNPRTGQALQPEAGNSKNTSTHKISTPLIYNQQSAHFEAIADYLQQLTGEKPVFAIHYWEHERYMLFAYNTALKGLQWLACHAATGKIVAQATLAPQARGFAEDVFFVLNNKLVVLLLPDGIQVLEM
ncbi:MAG: hypothetical protein RMJ87_07960 [Cytophagales bacterium]|nr:hypothetical protein [Bernardetiaceae bacterium]MDW8204946.1 hypothetical protein [Cytophagales bacterium]